MEEYNSHAIIRDIVTIIILGVATVVVQFPTPHQTTVIEGDISLSYPAGNTVPTIPWLILFYAIPIVILVIIYICKEKKFNLSVYKVVLFCAISIMFTESLCGALKIVTGRPRPSFFDLCGYPSSGANGTRIFGTPGVIANITKCANADEVKDAFKSYPSGHSAHSACAAGIAFLLILRLLMSIRGLKKAVLRSFVVLAGVICLCLPLYVGSSRIWDYKHRGDDVLAGYLTGIFCTLISYYFVYGFALKEEKKEAKELSVSFVCLQSFSIWNFHRSKLNSINGSSNSIVGTTEWLLENDNNAGAAVKVWKDVFIGATYQTKLYLFYLANDILVKERLSGNFKYTPEFIMLLPIMVQNSLNVILDPIIARKILGILRLWKNNLTMGRMMTETVLSSIPSQTFTQFPDFADLSISNSNSSTRNRSVGSIESRDTGGFLNNPNSSETVPMSNQPVSFLSNMDAANGDQQSNAENKASLLSEHDKIPEEEYTKEELADMRSHLPGDVKDVVDSVESCFSKMDEFTKMSEKIQVRREIIERIMAARTMTSLNESNSYEERLSKKQVDEECREFIKFCRDLISSLEETDSLLSQYETELNEGEERDRQMLDVVLSYRQAVVKNNELLSEEYNKLMQVTNDMYDDKRVETEDF